MKLAYGGRLDLIQVQESEGIRDLHICMRFKVSACVSFEVPSGH